MTIRNLRLSFFAVVMFFFCVCSVHAQSGQADVQGIVTDPTGSVIAGATVVLNNTDSGDKRIVTTGSDGRYSIPTVAPGNYSITVTAPSFSATTLTGLVIQLDNHLNQNVTLHAGSTTEEITVTCTASEVDTPAYEVVGVVAQAQIKTLPIPNRQYLALALLTPGTTQAA